MPYTRVRCYNFSKYLNETGMETDVFSVQEKFFPRISGDEMLTMSEHGKIISFIKSMFHLLNNSGDYLYLQKVHYHAAAPYLLTRLKLKKLILDYDDYDFDRSPMFSLPVNNRLIFGSNNINKITADIAKCAKACMVSSNHLNNIFLEFNKNTFYIPTGVDTDKFKPTGKKNENRPFTFLWNGKVWGDIIFNNIIFLFECFDELSSETENIRLIIAGDGALMNKLKTEQMARFPKLRIEFRNFVEPDRMPDLLNDCDAGLLPLITDTANLEWLKSKSPTKLFEYLAAGLPSVSSDFGETKYIIQNEKNGLLADSKKNFVNQMRRLVADKNLYLRISEYAVTDARAKYSLKILIQRLRNIILDILKQN